MHIIFVITFAPKYDFVGKNVPTPIHSWKNLQGENVSVWKEDWGLIFGNKMISKFDDITFEVVRADYRADKVYSIQFENGLLYKSFPGDEIVIRDGIKKRKTIYSYKMEQYIKSKAGKKETVLLIPAERTAFSIFFTELFSKKMPIIHFHWTNNSGILKKIEFTFHPFKLLHRTAVRLQRMKLNRKIKFLQVVHMEGINRTPDFINANVEVIGFGVDTDFWKPDMSKKEARERLNIVAERVLLFSCRLIEEYQIVEVLEVLAKFTNYNFKAFFTSYGDPDYLQKINETINRHKLHNHVKLLGYISDSQLKMYFSATDVFVMTSKVNAGPVSTFKAILMRVPIITTNSGRAAEVLAQNKAGFILSSMNYKQWEKVFQNFFNGENIPILEGDAIKEFHWDNNLKKWYDMMRLAIDYYSEFVHKVKSPS